MSLQVLADLSGLSAPFLSRVERGERSLDRRSHQIAVADALRVPVAELTGAGGDPHDPRLSAVHALVPPLRVALLELDLDDPPHDGQGRPLDAVAADLDVAKLAWERYDFTGMASTLPRLLGELYAATSGPDRRRALWLLGGACHVAHSVAACLGHEDLAMTAAGCQYDAAARLGDPDVVGGAQHTRVIRLASAGATRRAVRLGTRAITDLGNQALPARSLLSTATALAAARGRDATAAAELVDQAAEMAGHTGSGRLADDAGGLVYGPGNVAVERLVVALELGDVDAAMRATTADVADLPRPRLVHWHVGRGRAFAHAGRTADAVTEFDTAVRLAPLKVRADPLVRDAVTTMRTRAGGAQLAGLASRLGIPA